MDLSVLAATISLVAAVYVALIWYIVTRWLIRTLVDKPKCVPRVEVVLVTTGKDKLT